MALDRRLRNALLQSGGDFCACATTQSFVPFHSFRFCSNLLKPSLFKLDSDPAVRNLISAAQHIAYAGGR